MFYSHQILAKKGPLGTIWIAAHMDRKLRKNQIYDTNITSSVDTILQPQMPLALRLSGQLLLGVVRIYSRQVGYLFTDCSEALVKVKQVMRPGVGMVDLPAEASTASFSAVTLPDNYEELDLSASKAVGAKVDANISGRAAITLQEVTHEETFENHLEQEERFGIPEGEDYIDMQEEPELEQAGHMHDEAYNNFDEDAAEGHTLLQDYELGEEEGSLKEGPPAKQTLNNGENALELLDMDDVLPPSDDDEPLEELDPMDAEGMDDGPHAPFEEEGEEVETFRDASKGAASAGPTPINLNRNLNVPTPASLKNPPTPVPQPQPIAITPLQSALGMSTPYARAVTRSGNSLDLGLTPSIRGSVGVPFTPSTGGFGGIRVSVNEEEETTPNIRLQKEPAATTPATRKRKLVVDSRLFLSNDQIRDQLKNVTSIVRKRTRTVPSNSLVLQLVEGFDSFVLVPAVGSNMCPELYSLYARCLIEDEPLLPKKDPSSASSNVCNLQPSLARTTRVPTPRVVTPMEATTPVAARPEEDHQLFNEEMAGDWGDDDDDDNDGSGIDMEDAAPAHFMDNDAGGFDDNDILVGISADDLIGCGAEADKGVLSEKKDVPLLSISTEDGVRIPQAPATLSEMEEPELEKETDPETAEEAEWRAQKHERTTQGGQSLMDALHDGDGADDLTNGGARELMADKQPADGPVEGAWSQRTRSVLNYLEGEFDLQRRDAQEEGGGAMSGRGGAAVSAYGLLEGQSQREAARFFFEMLLLNNKGYVKLHQAQPFGDITICPTV